MKKQKKPKARNPFAVSASFRNSAGTMHHKNMPRGGANNEQAEYLEELEDETQEDCIEVSQPHSGSGVGSVPSK
jgi:hypothetical protein